MDDEEILQDYTQEETSMPIPVGEVDTVPTIYTGPNIQAFALMKYQVYREGLPAYVVRAIEKIPEIAELIVPISELEATKKKINTPGTNESRIFYAVQQEAEKVNAEYRKTLRRRRR